MTQKISKFIICAIAIMCMLCSSLTTLAVEGDLDFDFNIQPEVPTTQQETAPAETEKTTVKVTEKETQKVTEKETEKETEKPTTKPTKPAATKPVTTRPQHRPQANENNNNNHNDNEEVYENINANANDNVNVNPAPAPDNNVDANDEVQQSEKTTEDKKNTQAGTEETTDEPLPKGSFYVYLERNNGQRRLKTIMDGPGFLPEPEEPIRKGYVFAGWYKDADFKKKWNFFTDKAKKEMVIYAKWNTDEKTISYDIEIADLVGGKIEVSPKSASLGEPVIITVIPEEGKRLVQGSVKINGKATDYLNFIMPKKDVTISAEFEEIPENAGVVQEKSKAPVFIILGVLGVIIAVIVIVIAKRNHEFNADLEPDEELLYTNDDDYYDDWIDETIVVEDGFIEGKKVVENTEPDYGAPELDDDEE